MTANLPQKPTFSRRVLDALSANHSGRRWEQLITALLQRLELSETLRRDAEKAYNKLADQIATRLDIPRHDVAVYSQGSMRTQTTISPRLPANFDLDVVVELSGPKYANIDSETFFENFGDALRGNESETGDPKAKRRCWRLQYPGRPFYFDVTPAKPMVNNRYGSPLLVRDPDTEWSPSNPKEFADWFCKHAEQRFPFQTAALTFDAIEARKSVDPLPNEPVGIDDILRRTVQLIKLHRDHFYYYATDAQKEAQPISVIIVTLATRAYEALLRHRAHEFRSPIEVVLAIVEDMPKYFQNTAVEYRVLNPMLGTENFADRWNSDAGARAREFKRWHAQLEMHLEALLTQDYSRKTEDKISAVFGPAGVEAWKQSLESVPETTPLLKGLATSAGLNRNPTIATPVSRKTDTLA